MAETSWPYTDDATTDAEYSWLMRELGEGVTVSEGETTLQGSADSSGMVSFLEPGRAIVQGYMYRNSTQLTMTHSEATSNPRIDLVVIELDIAAVAPEERAVAVILEGTPASSPVAPTITQTDTGVYQFPLYQVYVGASATNIGPSDILDLRVWRGDIVSSWATSSRPANPRPNQLGYNTTLARWERWSGSSWVGFDASTVGGRQLLDGTNDPSAGAGSENSIYYKYQA